MKDILQQFRMAVPGIVATSLLLTGCQAPPTPGSNVNSRPAIITSIAPLEPTAIIAACAPPKQFPNPQNLSENVIPLLQGWPQQTATYFETDNGLLFGYFLNMNEIDSAFGSTRNPTRLQSVGAVSLKNKRVLKINMTATQMNEGEKSFGALFVYMCDGHVVSFAQLRDGTKPYRIPTPGSTS